MRLYLLGRGIQHSLSPGMWNGVFQRLGLGWRYGLLDVEDSPQEALEGLKDADVLGYNVTMPYKRWAFERSAIRSRDVERARGCNWIHAQDDRLTAHNTDVEGARMLLNAIPPSDHVLLLGAGGTAAAVLTALEGRADRVVVANRTHERAVELAHRASLWLGRGAVTAIRWEERMAEAPSADLIINTTSLGMRDGRSPFDELRLRDDARVYDVVYRAAGLTALQRQAVQGRLPLADGLAHLEAQAVALLPHFGLSSRHADLVRSSLAVAAGRSPHCWKISHPVTAGTQA